MNADKRGFFPYFLRSSAFIGVRLLLLVPATGLMVRPMVIIPRKWPLSRGWRRNFSCGGGLSLAGGGSLSRGVEVAPDGVGARITGNGLRERIERTGPAPSVQSVPRIRCPQSALLLSQVRKTCQVTETGQVWRTGLSCDAPPRCVATTISRSLGRSSSARSRLRRTSEVRRNYNQLPCSQSQASCRTTRSIRSGGMYSRTKVTYASGVVKWLRANFRSTNVPLRCSVHSR